MQAGYDQLATIVYEATTTSFVAISMTSAYAALKGGSDLDMPDLTSVPGFDSSWGLHAGLVEYNAVRTGGTLPIGRDTKPFDGATRRASTIQGTVNAP
jgi:hypothetical protein